MEPSFVLLRFVYGANVLVAGSVGVLALFAPAYAAKVVFSGTVSPSFAMQVVGAFWVAIAALSAVGLFYPLAVAPVLVLQVIYKGLWLLGVAVPALLAGEADALPLGMAGFFLIWVVALPFVIPWDRIVGAV